ncbi:MAG: hypothetical protein WKF40_04330 [Thermoleophilaceae bacterium]
MLRAMAAAASIRRSSPLGQGARILLALVTLMWVSEVLDTLAGHRLDQYGIEPRDAEGLPGIVTSPSCMRALGT